MHCTQAPLHKGPLVLYKKRFSCAPNGKEALVRSDCFALHLTRRGREIIAL